MSLFDDFAEENEAALTTFHNKLICELSSSVQEGDLTGHGMGMCFEMLVAEETVPLFGEDDEVRFNCANLIVSIFEQHDSNKIVPELEIRYFSVASEGDVDKSAYQFTGNDSPQSMMDWYESNKEVFGIPDTSDEIALQFFEAIMPILEPLKRWFH